MQNTARANASRNAKLQNEYLLPRMFGRMISNHSTSVVSWIIKLLSKNAKNLNIVLVIFTSVIYNARVNYGGLFCIVYIVGI